MGWKVYYKSASHEFESGNFEMFTLPNIFNTDILVKCKIGDILIVTDESILMAMHFNPQ